MLKRSLYHTLSNYKSILVIIRFKPMPVYINYFVSSYMYDLASPKYFCKLYEILLYFVDTFVLIMGG